MRLSEREYSSQDALMERDNASMIEIPMPHVADTTNSCASFIPPLNALSEVSLSLGTTSAS